MRKAESIWDRLKMMWAGRVPHDDGAARRSEDSRFVLMHKGMRVGTLEVKDGVWTFRYSKEFKDVSDRRTITEFPEVDKPYSSRDLWPFFQMRIPSLRQDFVREIMERENIDEDDEAQLLKRFGRRTVANPFELIPS